MQERKRRNRTKETVDPNVKKECNSCRKLKTLDMFARNPKNKKDGRAAKCHECHDLIYNKGIGNSLESVANSAYLWP